MADGKCPRCSVVLTEENTIPSVMTANKRADGSHGLPRGLCLLCSKNRLKQSREVNPKRFILYSSRNSSRIRGLENTLTIDDIPNIPKRCPVFPWIQIEHRVGEDIRDGSPSLDRVDNTIGYVKGNVRIISYRANQLKSDATDQELAALGNDATKRNKAERRIQQAEEKAKTNL